MAAGIVSHQKMPKPARPASNRATNAFLNTRRSIIEAHIVHASMKQNRGRTPELNLAGFPRVSGINPTCYCCKIDANREKTMSKTHVRLATLAIAAGFAFAGPAFADMMKVTLDSKSEVP